ASTARGHHGVDLALLTDGLRAEREQGITIDVAYRYFATPQRRFILADTPGHVQYTRNMVTGASTAQLTIVLVDARTGVVDQTRRHAAIAALLRVPHVVLAVNKMDLVAWDEQTFSTIEADFTELAKELGIPQVTAIPISALHGDNVVDASAHLDWYAGPTVLEHLETVPVDDTAELAAPARLP
ncbi:GTP-binding protein, partial [Mangrovactinospora gilvigrisea]|uniref:GTP-binding protein n=1 Tax=Mangrovactinospora gilvigrisea TaxID=1428644 RepID=UPI000A71151F